jgi:hypothetical protein
MLGKSWASGPGFSLGPFHPWCSSFFCKSATRSNFIGHDQEPKGYQSIAIMRRFLGLFMRFAWLAVCIVALFGALRGYEGKSDWKMEEGLASEMMILGFPASLLVALCFMAVGFLLQQFGLGVSLPFASRVEMITTWLIFLIVGYIQWFLILPYLIRRWRNARKVRSTPD